MGRSKSPKAEPTDEWELLLPLFSWPEQRAYEELRPLVLFGGSVPERARETGTPERTMYRRVERFKTDGMLSLFATDPAAAADTPSTTLLPTPTINASLFSRHTP